MIPSGSEPLAHLVIPDSQLRTRIATWLEQSATPVICHTRVNEFLERTACDSRGCLLMAVACHQAIFLRMLWRSPPPVPVIVLSAPGDIETAVQVMKDGAFDCLEAPLREAGLLDAVRAAFAHDSACWQARQRQAALRDRARSLTQREREVMDMLTEGMLNKVIASRLGLSRRTVETHRTNLMNKMHAESVAQLIGMSLALSVDRGVWRRTPLLYREDLASADSAAC